jgi:hypothetical protein
VSDSNPFLGETGPSDGDLNEVPAEIGLSNDVPEAPPRSYLDVDDDTANRYVRVKVDGRDEEVPLAEALKGYSRTADYTRKTQELANQRQQADYALAVERALRANPEETLRLLARQHGVNFEQSPPPQQREQPSPYDDGFEGYVDPVERRLADIERQNQALQSQWQQRQADEQLRQAVAGITQKYQLTPADAREVVSTAISARMGPESFDMIWKNIAFDRAAQVRQTAASRQRAAAQASQLVGNGASATRAGTAPAPVDSGPMTIAQAYELAERQNARRS